MADVDWVDEFCCGGYYRIKQDGKYGYAVKGGEITSPCVYDSYYTVLGLSYSIEDENGYHVISADGGDFIFDPAYTSVYPLAFGNGLFWRGYGAGAGYDLYDWHGNLLFANANGFSISNDGKYLMVEDQRDSSTVYKITYLGVDTSEEVQTATEAQPVTEAEPVTEAQPVTEPEPATEAQPVSEPEPVTEAQPATEPEPVTEAQPVTEPEPATEAEPVTEMQTAQGASPALTLLQSVSSLMPDFENQKESIKVILNSAVSMMDEADPAVGLLKGAITLLDTGAADQVSISSLLDSALQLMQ